MCTHVMYIPTDIQSETDRQTVSLTYCACAAADPALSGEGGIGGRTLLLACDFEVLSDLAIGAAAFLEDLAFFMMPLDI